MKRSFLWFSARILCILGSVLISMLELQFFDESAYKFIIFPVILLATLILVLIYFSSGNNAVFLMLYSIVLTFVLDILKKSVDIKILLLCLCCLGLLYAQSHFQANSERFCTPHPAFGQFFLILFICFSLTASSTFLIYRYVLEPMLSDRESFELLQQVEEEVEYPPEAADNKAPEEASDGMSGAGGAHFPLMWLLYGLAAICAVAIAVLILWVLTAFIRHRLWLRRTLSSSRERQVAELYRYTLRALSVYGCPRQLHETPFEYLSTAQKESFPLPAELFNRLSGAFIYSNFGGKSVSDADYATCLLLFRSISAAFRQRLGLRTYVLRYLIRMHCLHSYAV